MSYPRPPWRPPPRRTSTATRGYLREFDWEYEAPPPPEPLPPGSSGPGGAGLILIPVNWAGLPLNTGDQPNGLCSVVENVDGWLCTPDIEGNDAELALADGSAWGPKIYRPRTVIIDGAAVGPRPLLGELRDQIAARVAARQPSDLAITDGGLERTLVASVRADSTRYRQTWITPTAFRWQATVVAADPLLYEQAWNEAVLSNLATAETGRTYEPSYSGWWPPTDPPGGVGPGPPFEEPPGWDEETQGAWEPPAPPKDPQAGETRAYPNWRYKSPWTPNTATLINRGNVDSTVFILYEGDLTESVLTDDEGGIIRLAPLVEGMQIVVNSSTLRAEAEGGLSRASFILPGSRPMVVPPGVGGVRWHLYAAGRGQVTLAWRSAWF